MNFYISNIKTKIFKIRDKMKRINYRTEQVDKEE